MLLLRSLSCALSLLVLLALPARPAFADDASLQRAKALYLDGKREYEAGRFDAAYLLFQRAYISSPRPALLFNMANCLSALGRPAEAANQLRSYLAAVPNEPERATIEERIAELDRAAAPAANSPSQAESARNRELERRIRILEERLGTEGQEGTAPATPASSSRRGLAIGLGVTAAVLVLGGIGLGLGFGLSSGDPLTPSSYGGPPLMGTR